MDRRVQLLPAFDAGLMNFPNLAGETESASVLIILLESKIVYPMGKVYNPLCTQVRGDKNEDELLDYYATT